MKRVVFWPCRLRRQGQQTMILLKMRGCLASVPQASKKPLGQMAKQTLRDPFDYLSRSLIRILDFNLDGGRENVTKWHYIGSPVLILIAFCIIFRAGPVWKGLGAQFRRKATANLPRLVDLSFLPIKLVHKSAVHLSTPDSRPPDLASARPPWARRPRARCPLGPSGSPRNRKQAKRLGRTPMNL